MSEMSNKKLYIIGGGTNTYISNHLALSAPAYGTTAKHLYQKFLNHSDNKMDVELCLTKMADPSQDYLDTPEDVETLVDELIADPDTRVIIFNVAMVDYKPTYLQEWRTEDKTRGEDVNTFGKYRRRISTTGTPVIDLELKPYDKIINKIRKERKDILLVGFKTTCGATKEEQFLKGLKLCKDASANIVFVNDVNKERIEKLEEGLNILDRLNIQKTYTDLDINFKNLEKQIKEFSKDISELQNNGLVTPEESSYWYNTRDEALDGLVQMVLDRSHLHFTRSTVVDSETISWSSELIPETFKTIFDFVRGAGAYKLGPTKSTVGHFGLSLGPNEFLTSKRKTDFNKIEEVGLVRVITDDPDNVFGYKHFFEENHDDQVKYNSDQAVIAFGAKPSVGGQSQRSLFDAYPNLDCIVHFHCPLKPESRELFTTTKQFGVECGSHECGLNTSMNMQEFKLLSGRSVWAVHLDHHGPNIIFDSKTADPQEIIEFINSKWDLSKQTTGLSDELI